MDERERYTAIRRAIDKVRPGVRINVCRWDYPGTWVREIGSSWRICRDIKPKWKIVRQIIEENLYLGQYASPGAYNDMDMLEVGRGLAKEEDHTHFAVWCFMSSPLLIGCDLEKLKSKPDTLALLSSKDYIALNQDTVEPQGYVVKRDGDMYALVRDIEKPFGTKRAVLFVNLSDEPKQMRLELSEIDLADCPDDLRSSVKKADGACEAEMPAHGARIFIRCGCRRLERKLYEAETAYLSTYQELRKPNKALTGFYRQREGSSGGVVAAGLGGRPGNDLVWERVWSERGGEYQMTLAICGDGAEVNVEVNGEKVDASGRIALKPGINRIRLYNDEKALPEIDCMRLAAVAQ